jgi:hypothetical protein
MSRQLISLAAIVFIAGVVAAVWFAWPFLHPKKDAEVIAKVTNAVTTVKADEAGAVLVATEKANVKAIATVTRTHVAAARVRLPDSSTRDEFFNGVCGSSVYANDPGCDGHRGQP